MVDYSKWKKIEVGNEAVLSPRVPWSGEIASEHRHTRRCGERSAAPRVSSVLEAAGLLSRARRENNLFLLLSLESPRKIEYCECHMERRAVKN